MIHSAAATHDTPKGRPVNTTHAMLLALEAAHREYARTLRAAGIPERDRINAVRDHAQHTESEQNAVRAQAREVQPKPIGAALIWPDAPDDPGAHLWPADPEEAQ